MKLHYTYKVKVKTAKTHRNECSSTPPFRQILSIQVFSHIYGFLLLLKQNELFATHTHIFSLTLILKNS